MANMQPAYSNSKPLLVCYTITLIHGYKKGVKFCHLQHNSAKKYGPRKTFTKICLFRDWRAVVKIRTHRLHFIFQLVWGLNSRKYKVSNIFLASQVIPSSHCPQVLSLFSNCYHRLSYMNIVEQKLP